MRRARLRPDGAEEPCGECKRTKVVGGKLALISVRRELALWNGHNAGVVNEQIKRGLRVALEDPFSEVAHGGQVG